jgi:hypothetical protein
MNGSRAQFDLGFLVFIQRWSLAVAALALVFGTAVTADLRFAASLIIGAVFDIALFHAMTNIASRQDTDNPALRLSGFFLVMLVGKSLLILIAFLLPAYLDIYGMATGVLVVEITIMTVGSFTAAMRSIAGRTNPGG